MKIGKWILGLLAGIGTLLAIILGMKNGQSKRQFNKAVKDNKKKEQDIIKKESIHPGLSDILEEVYFVIESQEKR